MSFHEFLYISEKSDVVTFMCKSHVFIKILRCVLIMIISKAVMYYRQRKIKIFGFFKYN